MIVCCMLLFDAAILYSVLQYCTPSTPYYSILQSRLSTELQSIQTRRTKICNSYAQTGENVTREWTEAKYVAGRQTCNGDNRLGCVSSWDMFRMCKFLRGQGNRNFYWTILKWLPTLEPRHLIHPCVCVCDDSLPIVEPLASTQLSKSLNEGIKVQRRPTIILPSDWRK